MLARKSVTHLKNIYSNIFFYKKNYNSVNNSPTVRLSYVIFFKRVYFVRISGPVLRNSRKQYTINQTLTLSVRLKKESFTFNIPVHTKAICIFQ